MTIHRNFPHLAQRLFNVPLALHPQKAEIVMAALADRLGITKLFRPFAFDDGVIIVDPDTGGVCDQPGEQERLGYDIHHGVALIQVHGTLVAKSGYLRPLSGMTGYDGIRINFADALTNPTVRAIMLDIDSPGGEVAGCFDLCDMIYQARGIKPIWAVLNESAYSAAYAIASAADRITVPRTGGTGSVGIIMMHVDFSKALSEAGIAVTLIHYGARKTDGNEYQPLAPEALRRFQAEIDTMGDLFVGTVARNRGLSPDAVRATQATTFLGADGVRVGFADATLAPCEAFEALLTELG